MKWVKHDTDANRDAKLEKVLMRYGAEGYALYWLCIELIAAPIDKTNLTFELEHDSEILAYRLKMDSVRVEEIMKFMVNLDLFEISETTQRITCLKLANRIENSIVKNPELKKIQEVIRENEKSQTISDNLGQTRLDETRKEKPKDINFPKFSEDDLMTAHRMHSMILELNSNAKEPNFDSWADTIRLMRERDNRSINDIMDTFTFANNDDFWQDNILSPLKLRKHFDKLQIKINKLKPLEPAYGEGAL